MILNVPSLLIVLVKLPLFKLPPISNVPAPTTIGELDVIFPETTKEPDPDLRRLPLVILPETVDVTPVSIDKVLGSPPRLILEIVLLLFDVKIKFLSVKVMSPDNVNIPEFVVSPNSLEDWTEIVLLKLLALVLFEDNVPPLRIIVPVPNVLLFETLTVPSLIIVEAEKFEILVSLNVKVPLPVLVIV